MNETDYLLLVTHDRLNISAKFYDYIGAGKPILATVHPEGDVRRLLEDLRAGWWAGNRDVEGIRQLFFDAAARGNSAAQRVSTRSREDRAVRTQGFGKTVRQSVA